MATVQPAKPQQAEEAVVKENFTTEQPAQPEQPAAFVTDDVTSFMEAKEFFINNYGVARSEVTNKEAIAQLCKQYNVTFPNYPL